MPNLSLVEQETVIRWDRASDDAVIYTHEPRLITMLERRRFQATCQYAHDGRVVARSYVVPKTWISVRPPRKASPAQREALARARAQQAASPGDSPPLRVNPPARAEDLPTNGTDTGSPPVPATRRPQTVTQEVQTIQVALRPDNSELERKIDELAARIEQLAVLLQGHAARPSYTPAQAAERLQIPRKRVYEAIQQRRIRAVQIGRQWRVPTASLLEWLETGDTPTAEPAVRLEPPRRRRG